MIKTFENIEALPVHKLTLKPQDTLIIKIDLDKYDIYELEQWLKIWQDIFPNNVVSLAPIDVDFVVISNE